QRCQCRHPFFSSPSANTVSYSGRVGDRYQIHGLQVNLPIAYWTATKWIHHSKVRYSIQNPGKNRLFQELPRESFDIHRSVDYRIALAGILLPNNPTEIQVDIFQHNCFLFSITLAAHPHAPSAGKPTRHLWDIPDIELNCQLRCLNRTG